jgi:hypothetical protein
MKITQNEVKTKVKFITLVMLNMHELKDEKEFSFTAKL